MTTRTVFFRTIAWLFVGLAMACAIPAASPPPGTSPAVTTAPSTPVFVVPGQTTIAVVILDYQTLQLKNVYLNQFMPCSKKRAPISDEELTAHACTLLSAAKPKLSCQYQISHVGDFAVLIAEPLDFGASAVFDACSGLAFHAGTITWMGTGRQFYPTEPLNSAIIQETQRSVRRPTRVDVVIGPYAPPNRAGGIKAWESIRNLNIVQELATRRYSVLVYLYPRSVGLFSPGAADWVIFVRRTAP